MSTMNVPCDRCDEFRQRFEATGDFRVLGCEADAGDPGMCTLRFERIEAAPLTVAAAAAVPTAMPDAAGADRVVDAAAGEPLLTDTQARTAKAIVNIFETGSVLGDYGGVTLLEGDSGRLTYGRSQTTLASGNLFLLLQRYCANPGARYTARLAPWLPRVLAMEAVVDQAVRLHNLLRACADDTIMRETQDQFFDAAYWVPALRAAKLNGIVSPLGIAVVYDSHVHGSWGRLRAKTIEAAGTPAAIGERAWITAYVATRRSWLATHPSAILRATTYRMDAFKRLIDQGFWGLRLPLVVRDLEISPSALAGVPLGCYDGPAPGTRALALATPLLRGLDVRLAQLGLSNRGVDIKADGIFGQTSRRRLAEYQVAHGLAATGLATPELVLELAG